MITIENKKELLLKELKRISSFKLLPDEFDKYDICMFGGGKIGRFGFQGLHWYFGQRLKYVCDNNPMAFQDKIYKGRKVLTIKELAKVQNKCVVLIAASEKYSYDIAQQLEDSGIENIRLFNGDPVTRFMDICFAKYAYKMLDSVWSVLSDDISKALLLERLCEIFYHLELPIHSYISTPQPLIPPKLRVSKIPLEHFYNKHHYFPEDIIHLSENECLVDGGAYIGDTIESFINITHNRFDKVYAFELESINFEKCRKTYENDDRIEVFPCGISDSEKDVFISINNNDQEHRISSKGETTSKTVTLDTWLKNKKITFIKMDIEGEELAALEGGKEIIKTQKPTLAISAYHKASDIFDIPLWIKSICKNYKIYLRHHGNGCLFETVCYAISEF